MSDPDRHRITVVEVMAIVLVITVIGWLLLGQASESPNLLGAHPAPVKPSSPVALPASAMRERTVLNNLRLIATASAQYMLDKGVTYASYRDLVGIGTDHYLRSISPVAGEDYTHLTVVQTQTQISISSAAFGLVTYNL